MCPSTENTVSRDREDTRIANRDYEDNPNETNQHNNTESVITGLCLNLTCPFRRNTQLK